MPAESTTRIVPTLHRGTNCSPYLRVALPRRLNFSVALRISASD